MNSFLWDERYFIILGVLFLLVVFYLNIRYKKNIIKLNALIEEKDNKIKSLLNDAYEDKLTNKEQEHQNEKEILHLNQKIKELESTVKEGLKSQIVRKIEEVEKRRERQLTRVNLSI